MSKANEPQVNRPTGTNALIAPGFLHEGEAQPRWRTLLSQVRSVQIELARGGTDRRLGLAGNPSAPECAIAVAELRLGFSLPQSYRQFLAYSDGWPNFYEGAHLLGTAEVGRPTCLDLALERQMSRPNPLKATPGFEHMVPFGAAPNGDTLFAFDPTRRHGDSEMPVVAWIGGLGVDCRCFTEFLATVLQLCRSETTFDVSAKTTAEGERGIGATLQSVRPGLRSAKPLRPNWARVG